MGIQASPDENSRGSDGQFAAGEERYPLMTHIWHPSGWNPTPLTQHSAKERHSIPGSSLTAQNPPARFSTSPSQGSSAFLTPGSWFLALWSLTVRSGPWITDLTPITHDSKQLLARRAGLDRWEWSSQSFSKPHKSLKGKNPYFRQQTWIILLFALAEPICSEVPPQTKALPPTRPRGDAMIEETRIWKESGKDRFP